MITRLAFTPNQHQRIFYQDLYSKMLHLSTGFGGGKTHVLCQKLLLLSKLNYPHPGGLVAPDYADFKKDVLPEMENILDQNNIKYKYHGSDHYFEFPWTPGKLFVQSAEKKIRGPNWAYAGINEVTLIPLLRYREVLGRVRVKGAKAPQIISVGTPEGFASDYYDFFIEKPPENFRIVYGTTDNNLMNLNEDYISLLESTYDRAMLDAYRNGLWVNMATNRFYYSFAPQKNHNRSLFPNQFTSFHVSMDFNVDPMTATVWGFDGYKIYGVGQICLEGDQGYRTENMVTAMQSRGLMPANCVIYPDPAGKARSTQGLPDVTILRNAGYECRVKTVAPRFRQRQLNVNNLLDKSRIIFNPDLCPGINKDLQAVEQNILTLEKSKSNPKLTHFSDGLDYMVDYLFPFSGNTAHIRQEKFR